MKYDKCHIPFQNVMKQNIGQMWNEYNGFWFLTWRNESSNKWVFGLRV